MRPIPRRPAHLPALTLAAVAATLLLFAWQPWSRANAAGSCNATSAELTAEETEMISLIGAWRRQNFPGAMAVEITPALNAAASHYAAYLAVNPGAAGHYAEPGYTSGYPWARRAVDCGYPSNWAAGGEGLAVVMGSPMPSVPPSQALAIMTDTAGGTHLSGLHHPRDNARCLGVAVVRDAANKKVAWVALLFQYSSSAPCPQALTAPTNSATATPTAPVVTATPTNTPRPTATPTPVTFRAIAPQLSKDER